MKSIKINLFLPLAVLGLSFNAQAQYLDPNQDQDQYQQQYPNPDPNQNQGQYQKRYQNPNQNYNSGNDYNQNAYQNLSPQVRETSVYFKGALGASSQSGNNFADGDIDYQASGVTSFSLGMNLGQQFSTEMELAFRNSEIESIDGAPYYGELSSSALMFNAYFKLPLTYGYKFFVGAGAGFLGVELEDLETANIADGASLASQLMIGLEAQVSDHLDVALEYKSLSSLGLELTGTSGAFGEDFNFENGSVLLGLRYNF